MQMLDRLKKTKIIKLKKSQMLLIGSLLVFVGIIILSWNTFILLRNEVYSDLKIDAYVTPKKDNEEINNIPIVNNLPNDQNLTNNDSITTDNSNEVTNTINYDQYLGVLEIPKIGLKRGFYDVTSKYNDIQYNVAVVRGSTLPDVNNGNLILMAHSGDAYISYFAYLYRLNVGDYVYVTYNKVKYTYVIVNIYDVAKVGQVSIYRNYNKTTLTLITCTKDNDSSQTVYIAEQV